MRKRTGRRHRGGDPTCVLLDTAGPRPRRPVLQ